MKPAMQLIIDLNNVPDNILYLGPGIFPDDAAKQQSMSKYNITIISHEWDYDSVFMMVCQNTFHIYVYNMGVEYVARILMYEYLHHEDKIGRVACTGLSLYDDVFRNKKGLRYTINAVYNMDNYISSNVNRKDSKQPIEWLVNAVDPDNNLNNLTNNLVSLHTPLVGMFRYLMKLLK